MANNNALYVAYPDRDLLVVSRGIDRQLYLDMSALMRERKHDKCVLFLTTYGGDAHAGYRTARCLRHHYTHVRLVVPSLCKSAGTLIAICANELAIADLGELGPLDVQVTKPNELAERGSGLDVIEALNMTAAHAQQLFTQNLLDLRRNWRLSTKLAGEFASEFATGLVQPLYAQIDPTRLGEMNRATRIAQEYGMRLHGYAQSLLPGALETLVAGYPSHGFVIDRKEAKTLFSSVHTPTEAEQTLCSILWPQLGDQTNSGPYFVPRLDPIIGDDDAQQPEPPQAGPAAEPAPFNAAGPNVDVAGVG
jgi:hypothetical protein